MKVNILISPHFEKKVCSLFNYSGLEIYNFKCDKTFANIIQNRGKGCFGQNHYSAHKFYSILVRKGKNVNTVI